MLSINLKTYIYLASSFYMRFALSLAKSRTQDKIERVHEIDKSFLNSISSTF
jgi:hypothetical protein